MSRKKILSTQQHDACPHDQGTWQHFTCYQAVSEENKRDKRQCPACDTNDALRLVASRVTTLSSVTNSQLYPVHLKPPRVKETAGIFRCSARCLTS